MSQQNSRLTPSFWSVILTVLPKRLISQLMGYLGSRQTSWVRRFMIHQFAQHYGVNMQEALLEDLNAYPTFNAFFTRQLKPDARTIDERDEVLASPADGAISERGHLHRGLLLQAKGHLYSVETLLGKKDQWSDAFQTGSFTTIYLAPKDYHWFHMPYTGRCVEIRNVPGKLFPVNTHSVAHVENLFAQNERMVCLFETDLGKMAVIPVGALIVGSIELSIKSLTNRPNKKRMTTCVSDVLLQKGDPLGCFKMGSTVIVLMENSTLHWSDHLKPGASVRLGEALGHCS